MKVLSLITQQTNLATIIFLTSFIGYLIYYVYGAVFPTVNIAWVTALWAVFTFIEEMVAFIGICLSLPSNTKAYICLCKCCHNRCVGCCSKLVRISTNNNAAESDITDNCNILELHQSLLVHQEQSTLLECKDGKYCIIIEEMKQILGDDGSNPLESSDKTDILNKFDHLTSSHNEEDIALIPHDLPRCSAMTCYRYRRSTRTNRANTDIILEEKIDEVDPELSEIMDRLHVYYMHSDDTKIRAAYLNNNETTNINAAKSSKSKPWSFNTSRSLMSSHSSYYDQENDQIITNKFASNLEADDSKDNKEDMYSFGFRFEYNQYQHQLFVSCKYDNLKRELIDNAMISINNNEYIKQYNKTATYMKTNRIKAILKSTEGETIMMHHILSLLIYCNCDLYQMKWSESFRKTSSDEDMESVKIRHSHFVHSSKYLIELVEKFGTRLMDGVRPFYHGVNSKLYFNRTVAQFNSPLSTSLKWSVAHNFSAGCGLVLELKYAFSSFPLMAKYFNCSFFSDFSYEKECLFIGGIPILRIINITNMSDNADYRKYIQYSQEHINKLVIIHTNLRILMLQLS